MPCVFCRKDATLTAEHVLPQWIRPHVSDPGGRGTHTRTEIRVGEWVDERSFAAKPAALKVRSVCATCNNGWMSDLEDEAKPFLLSMINGHRRTYYRRGQCLIATWLLKTALVAGSKFEPALPSDFYERLYAERQPSDDTRVWLARTPYREHHQSDFRPIRVHPDDQPPPDKPNALSAMISVANLAGFLVCWLDRDPPLSGLDRFAPALVRIWPYEARSVTWPPLGGGLDFTQLDQLADSLVPVPAASDDPDAHTVD